MSFLDYTRPSKSLTSIFLAWKVFLFAIAFGSGVGPAYDTSSTLLLSDDGHRATHHESVFDLATRLTRWDAIYFVEASRRGYREFEQEWAFASGLPTVIYWLTQVLTNLGVPKHEALEPLIGIFVATVSHLLSVLVLYKLSLTISRNVRWSFLTAVLHIFSPAGLFLSAPYSESPYSLLSFLGYLFFAKAVILSRERTVAHDVSLIASGLWFSFAVNFRSNGVLNGCLFAFELAREMSRPPTGNSVRRRLALLAGGSAIAIGFLIPQVIAYQTYCYRVPDSELRPWCTERIPSIYTFVQARYWNVGFLRYWTLPNIPLFLLAGPVLFFLSRSGITFLSNPQVPTLESSPAQVADSRAWFLRSTACIQLLLTVLAITTYHTQIITRLSSGYPLWYWWVANLLSNKQTANTGQRIVMFMVVYAGIQGALFASFLPPA